MTEESEKQKLISYWRQAFGFDEGLLKAFEQVRREEFVPDDLKTQAYEDKPLPLMRNKTISQPTTVMIMTAALQVMGSQKVFEVGSGSGYQAAILSQLVGPSGKVISTEIIPELVQFARKNLTQSNISNVTIYEEDGSRGLEEEAPFQRIIITAACSRIPDELVHQVIEGGIIVAPVGDRDHQEMVVARKEEGELRKQYLGPFLFTPLYGTYGFEV